MDWALCCTPDGEELNSVQDTSSRRWRMPTMLEANETDVDRLGVDSTHGSAGSSPQHARGDTWCRPCWR
jgi:hypothetical protein